MIEVEAFICEYCKAAGKVKRAYCSRQSAKRHESWCCHNPETRSCATCGLWLHDDDGTNSLSYCYDEHDEFNEETRVRRPISRCAFWITEKEAESRFTE